MTAAEAITWMARGLAIAASLGAIELLAVRRALADDGPFAWSVLGRALAGWPRPARALADRALGYRGTCALLAAQLAAAGALPLTAHPAPAWTIAATVLAIAFRFGGTYNGGSDAMTLIVAVAVAVARTWPGGALADGALAYAAAQLVLSYTIAGVAKLGDPAWRRGSALAVVVALPQYRVPARARAALRRPWVSAALGAAMLAFECAFPLALTGPRACRALLAIAGAFHLANAGLFGLSRFLWAWLACYPALVYWADRVGG